MEKIIGQTKDRGFQIGVRKILPISYQSAWDFLFSDEGLKIWLGKIKSGEFELDKSFKTKEGIEGKVNVFKTNSHIRLTWKPKNWANISAIQIRVINAKGKTTISFHQDKLLNTIQRDKMKKYWDTAIEKIAEKLKYHPKNKND